MNLANGPGFSRSELLALVARLALVTAMGYLSMRWIINQMDPTNKSKKKAKRKVHNDIRPRVQTILWLYTSHIKIIPCPCRRLNLFEWHWMEKKILPIVNYAFILTAHDISRLSFN